MNDINLLSKRVRRGEVTELALAEEVSEIRASLRAVYEAIILISRRLPPATLGSDPADVLMLPPWHDSPKTGGVLPPPRGLDLEQKGLGSLRATLSLLLAEQLAEVHRCQERHVVLLDTLLKREAERELKLRKFTPGPTM